MSLTSLDGAVPARESAPGPPRRACWARDVDMSSTTLRVISFVVSLGAFVLVRMLTRGLPWWLSVALAVAAMLVAGRMAGVVAVDLEGRLRRRRADALRRGGR